MTKMYSNAAGNYFYASTKVTSVYSVVEMRYVGAGAAKYHVSTGKNIKATFSDLGSAVLEAIRRQNIIDRSN